VKPPNKFGARIVLATVLAMVGRMAFKFTRTNYNDPDREWRERLDRIEDMLAFLIDFQWETIAMITPQIQDALDRIRQTQSLAHASVQALVLQSTQIGTLTDKVAELQAKVDAGGTISAEDLAAVAEISSDIDSTNAELQSAVPANTAPAGGQPPTPPVDSPAAPATGGEGQPPAPVAPAAPPEPPSEEDAAAAAAAKPL
jgi:hypothetical protein